MVAYLGCYAMIPPEEVLISLQANGVSLKYTKRWFDDYSSNDASCTYLLTYLLTNILPECFATNVISY